MLSQLRRALRPPVRDDQEEQYIRRVLRLILLLSVAAPLLMLVSALVVGHTLTVYILAGFILLIGLLYLGLRQGYVCLVSLALPIAILVAVNLALFGGFGIHDLGILIYPLGARGGGAAGRAARRAGCRGGDLCRRSWAIQSGSSRRCRA